MGYGNLREVGADGDTAGCSRLESNFRIDSREMEMIESYWITSFVGARNTAVAALYYLLFIILFSYCFHLFIYFLFTYLFSLSNLYC